MAFDFDQPQPLQAAMDTIAAKTPVGTALGTAQLAALPRELREAAQFSAKVESVRAMQEVQDALTKIVGQIRDEAPQVPSAANAGQPGAYQMDRSKFIAEIQKTANRLGLRTQDQEKRGSIEDFGSERRLALIYEQQIGAAQARAYYLQGMDPDVLDSWPAQELVRIRDSKLKRDWHRRWSEAGGPGSSDGRMIALKTDAVWRKLSRFDRPYPPFDFGSGMGIEEIDRTEAEERGLLAPETVLQPSTEVSQPQADLTSLSPELRAAFDRAFTGAPPPAPRPPAIPTPAPEPAPALP